MCKREFLHYLRVREWQDVHSQLRRACKDIGVAVPSTPADPDRVHRALVAGLLSHVGSYDPARRDYLGARGRRFVLHPGSALARKPPAFVMAAELVETSRLFARVAARVDPLVVEQVAGDLVARAYSEPRGSKKRAAVVATERVTLYGVPLVAARTVQYGRIDPETSRNLFVRHALVQGEWDAHHAFLRENARRVAEVEELEERTRRRDLLVDEQDRYAFFDARVPADVVSGRHFDSWWKRARRETPDQLTYPRDFLRRADDQQLDDGFPRVRTFGAPDLPALPAIAETYPEVVSTSWFAVVAPPKTPPVIAAKLSQAFAEILREPEIEKKWREMTLTPVGGTPEEVAAFLKAETARWRKVIVSGGIKRQ
jgi:ATP-dependent helicase HrpA